MLRTPLLFLALLGLANAYYELNVEGKVYDLLRMGSPALMGCFEKKGFADEVPEEFRYPYDGLLLWVECAVKCTIEGNLLATMSVHHQTCYCYPDYDDTLRKLDVTVDWCPQDHLIVYETTKLKDVVAYLLAWREVVKEDYEDYLHRRYVDPFPYWEYV